MTHPHTTAAAHPSGADPAPGTATQQVPEPGVPKEHTSRETHAIHLRNVPLEIWTKARLNAVLSNMPVKHYLMRLIAESKPFPLDDQKANHTAP
jgi:hypothetical protein